MYKRIVTQSRMSTFPRLGNRSKMPIPAGTAVIAERCRFFVQEEVNTDLSFVWLCPLVSWIVVEVRGHDKPEHRFSRPVLEGTISKANEKVHYKCTSLVTSLVTKILLVTKLVSHLLASY